MKAQEDFGVEGLIYGRHWLVIIDNRKFFYALVGAMSKDSSFFTRLGTVCTGSGPKICLILVEYGHFQNKLIALGPPDF